MALTYGGKRKPGGTGPTEPLDPLEQALTDRIAAVIRALGNSTDVAAYTAAITALDPDALERLLAQATVGQLGARIEETLKSVLMSGAESEALKIVRETPIPAATPARVLEPSGVRLPSGIYLPGLAPHEQPTVDLAIGPDMPRTPEGRLAESGMLQHVDNRATEYARTRSAQLVTQIDESNRLAIRRIITRSFTDTATVDVTARRLRQVVGLHSRWANAVLNFDDRNMRALMKDGMATEAARARADVLTKRYRDRLIRRRAEMIARTEIMQAQNAARAMAWDAGNRAGYVDGHSTKVWSTAPSGSRYGPPCPICQENAGKEVPWNGAFPDGHTMPPAHPHCFVAGTIVDGPAVTGSTARWFEGEVIELTLSEGTRLTGTPNHPVLTPQGWVPLGSLDEGMEVVRRRDFERAAASVDPDDDQHPARIENVAESVGGAGSVPAREVPVAAPDFHGDGLGSEVAVVRSNRLLRDDVDPTVEEPVCEHRLGSAVVVAAGLDGGGGSLLVLDRVTPPPAGFVGGLGVDGPLFTSAGRRDDSVGLGELPGLHIGEAEYADDDVSTYPESVRERLHRLAPEVSLGDLFRCGVDVVTSVVRRGFAGHVYNLETVDGWYSANGIIVHNCRCTAVLVPPKRGLTGLPSQDMDSWLAELDAMDAEPVAKHGDPSRPGYELLHPNTRPGVPRAQEAAVGHDSEPLPAGWSMVTPEQRVDERMAIRDAWSGDQSSPDAQARRDNDLWAIRREEAARTVYEGAGGARVYLDRIPLAGGEVHHVVSQAALRPILKQIDRLQTTDPIGDVDITITNEAFRGRDPKVMGWALLGHDRTTLTAQNHAIRPAVQRIALNPTGVVKGGPVNQGFTDHLMPSAVTHSDYYYVTHEWGHALDMRYPDRARDDHQEIGRTPALLGSLSTYGRSNEYESYAESYAEWALSGGQTTNPVAQHFAAKYGWGSTGDFVKAVSSSGVGRVCVDTFTMDPPPTIETYEPAPVVVKSLTVPVLKYSPDQPRDAHGRWTSVDRWAPSVVTAAVAASTVASRVGTGHEMQSPIFPTGLGNGRVEYVARRVVEQRFNAPAPVVSRDDFIALARSGDYEVIARGGPVGVGDSLTSGRPWIGSGVDGCGSYFTRTAPLAFEYGDGEVVVALLPKSARRGEGSFGSVRMAGEGIDSGGDYLDSWSGGDNRVVFNTGALIVPSGPRAANDSLRLIEDIGPDAMYDQGEARSMVKAESEQLWEVQPDGTVRPVARPVLKHLPGQHDQKTHGRGGNHGLPTDEQIARAQETGESMHLPVPCPPELQAQWDAAVDAGGALYTARRIDAEGDALIAAGMQFAVEHGMSSGSDVDDYVYTSAAETYGRALLRRRMNETVQQRAWDKAAARRAESLARIVRDVRETGTVAIAVRDETVHEILDDGRFLSQFEANDSGGKFDTDMRAMVETALFDHHPHVVPAQRPIYGYLAPSSTAIMSPGVSQYGDARFVLKPEVHARTTMTIGDSLNTHSTPIPLVGDVTERDVFDASARTILGDDGAELVRSGPDRFTDWHYFETQIHGGVSLDDVAEVHLSRDLWAGDEDYVASRFEEYGIPVVWH